MDIKITLGTTGVSALLLLLLYRRFLKKSSSLCSKYNSAEHQVWNTALFFPDHFPENEDSTTRQLIWYLNQATTTIDVCVFGFAFKMLKDTLVELARKGVAIRIITNRTVQYTRAYRAAGIQTRAKKHIWKNTMDPTQYVDLMHHKFVVIDGFAVLTGSLNWTWASISENSENVLITNNAKCVKKYSMEFERLWEESGSKLYTDADEESKGKPLESRKRSSKKG